MIYFLVDIVNNKIVVVVMMKFIKNIFRLIIVDDSDFFEECCFLRMFKMLVNGRMIILVKRCVMVNVMLKIFVGLLKYFKGFLFIM